MIKARIRRLLRRLYTSIAFDSIQRAKETHETTKYLSNDIKALQALLPLRTSAYIPASSFSLSVAALVTILNDIIFHNRQTIVELGTGISTFYIARLLQQRQQGHIYSVENDLGWHKMYQRLVEQEQLQDWITLIYAPLAQSPHYLFDPVAWYDTEILSRNIPPADIDVLIIDGPWRNLGKAVRYPAIPFFETYMAEECFVLFDDIQNHDEQATIKSWEQSLDFQFHPRRNFAVAIRGSDFIASV